MSYEGYIQYWCAEGHYWESDCYVADDNCPHCRKLSVFDNSVDETNGESWGYIHPRMKEPDVLGVSAERLNQATEIFVRYLTVGRVLAADEVRALKAVLAAMAPQTVQHATYEIPDKNTTRQYRDGNTWVDCP